MGLYLSEKVPSYERLCILVDVATKTLTNTARILEF